jgi:DNA-binding XRE family transcriptional regulator
MRPFHKKSKTHQVASHIDLAAVQASALHPLVKELIEIRTEADIGRVAAAQKIGIHSNTLRGWETDGKDPSLSAFTAALNFFGYELAIVRRRRPEAPTQPPAGKHRSARLPQVATSAAIQAQS